LVDNRKYRLAIPSSLVLLLLLGGFTWMNLRVRNVTETILKYASESHALWDFGMGWPCEFSRLGWKEVDLDSMKEVAKSERSLSESNIDWVYLFADIGIALAVALLGMLACEIILRRRARSRSPSAAIRFTWRRLLLFLAGFACIAIGICFEYRGWCELSRLSSGEKNIIFGDLDVHLNHHESVYSIVPALHHFISFNLILGAFIFALGILLNLRRFSLRWLILASLLAALSGAIPFSIRSATTAFLRIHLNTPLNNSAIDGIRERLQPAIILASAPSPLLSALHMENAKIITAYQLKTPSAFDGSPYLELELKFDADASSEQIETFVDFYWQHYRALTLANTTERVPDSLPIYHSLPNSLLSQPYQDAWESELSKQNFANKE
jgi:hypothetical protein